MKVDSTSLELMGSSCNRAGKTEVSTHKMLSESLQYSKLNTHFQQLSKSSFSLFIQSRRFPDTSFVQPIIPSEFANGRAKSAYYRLGLVKRSHRPSRYQSIMTSQPPWCSLLCSDWTKSRCSVMHFSEPTRPTLNRFLSEQIIVRQAVTEHSAKTIIGG